jgi:hypothetical protein
MMNKPDLFPQVGPMNAKSQDRNLDFTRNVMALKIALPITLSVRGGCECYVVLLILKR